MLHELLKGIKYLSKEHDCKTRFIEHTSSLKRYLQQEYSNEIANILFTLSISTHVHTLLQHFMIVVYEILTSLKHLGECFWTKLQGRQKGDITWPLNPEELPSRVHTGPLQEIYNATYLSI